MARFRRLTAVQRNTFVACFLGWSLDAFDFFILVFCVNALAHEFHASVSEISKGIFLTLAMRPLGAFLFGMLADRFGRRPTLMADIIAYSVFELASAFAPTLKIFLITRALFGIAMGGEWGVGAALTFETLPAEGRGFFSGLLQEGYVVGYLIAAVVYGTLFPLIGWRGMFVVGALPAFLVIYIRTKVDESPAWKQGRVSPRPQSKDRKRHCDLSRQFSVPGCPHVRVQLVQSRHTGFISNIPRKESRVYAAAGANGFGNRQYRSAIGWNSVRNLIGEDRAPPRDRDGCTSRDSNDSPVGLFAHAADAGARRIPDAVHGAGCVGSHPGPFERTLSGGGARHVSRVCLPVGKPAGVVECGISGATGRSAIPWQLCASFHLDGADSGQLVAITTMSGRERRGADLSNTG